MNEDKIGKIISQKRKEMQLTQCDLADKIGISRDLLCRWEFGHSIPSIHYIMPLCNTLRLDVNELFGINNKKVFNYDVLPKIKNNWQEIKNIFKKTIVNWFQICGFLITILSIVVTYISLDVNEISIINNPSFKEIIIFISLSIVVLFLIVLLIKFFSLIKQKND